MMANAESPFASVSPSGSSQDLSEMFTIGANSGFFGGGALTRTGSNGNGNGASWTRASKEGAEDFQSITSVDDPDLVYAYDDADTLLAELSELYSYSEIGDFAVNHLSFTDLSKQHQQRSHPQLRSAPPSSADHSPENVDSRDNALSWGRLTGSWKDSLAEFLLEQCERSEPHARSSALRAVLYLLQGAFRDVGKDWVVRTARDNAFRFYRLGGFQIFVQLLLLEADTPRNLLRAPALSIADSREMRVILNILYTMVEFIRRPELCETKAEAGLRASLIDELGTAIFGKTILLFHLFELFMKYASNTSPHYPLKKLLLLIWKTILVSCGGMDELRANKNLQRNKAGLLPVVEDTLDVAKKLRASSPPLSASDMMDGNKGRQTRPLAKYKPQPAKDVDSNMAFWFTNVSESDEPPSIDEDKDDKEELEVKHIEHPTKRTDSHPEAFTTRPETPGWSKGLPWTPKVRSEEIERFIQQSRDKFVGVSVPDETASDVGLGLPKPIEESIRVMRRYVYTSLSDVQIKKEEGIFRYPMSQKEDTIVECPVERVYQALLPQMGNHVIALLKVLLASSPTSKPKTESLNVVTDVLPEQMPISVIQSMKMGIDTNRHKEIIVKAISSIIILMLKHFKISHVYQFETLAQHLVMANCMALILKFLNQNILGYVLAKNEISILNYPACCYVNQMEMTKEHLESVVDQAHCWRNLHSCITLVRVLNKLAKWKRSRVLVLVLFKSAAILKRALRIRHPVMQLYTLKALKLQSKFLGRQWRRLNMRVMSAIYEKVRHRLMDDWAYGNVPEHEVKRVDCQIEERKLRVVLDAFNNRRYHETLRPNLHYVQPGLEEFQPLDHSLASALSIRIRIPEHFKCDYEGWLQREVYQSQIDWDKLLANNSII